MKDDIIQRITAEMESEYALVWSDPDDGRYHKGQGDGLYKALEIVTAYLIDPVTVTVTPPAKITVTVS